MGWFGRKKTADETEGPEERTEAAVEPRRKIGKYEILERIATGGFGTVYKAWDPLIQRSVALKTCEIPDAGMRSRVFREAQLAGNLQHPNITTIYEFGVDGILPFLVQELLSGEDLERVIARGDSLPLAEKVRILIAVASALDCAHRAGVIHRDVKPGNIRILDNGVVKIMDFGIAKSLAATTDITKDGSAVGSTGYMSPEQIVGETVDARTDIFSFGVTAYELLSLRKPFFHEKLFLLLEQIVKTEPPPLSAIVPQVPAALVAIVVRAMRKNPDERFASASELQAALEAALETLSDAPTGGQEDPEAREAGRLEALGRYGILDTGAEPEFDDLARLASVLCETPLASLYLADRDRLWFKSRVGFEGAEIPLRDSLGARALKEPDVVVVRDAAREKGFAEGPLVEGVGFYASAPLRTAAGHVLGGLCVMDRLPKDLTEGQIESLRALSRQAVAQLELRRLRREQSERRTDPRAVSAGPPPPEAKP